MKGGNGKKRKKIREHELEIFVCQIQAEYPILLNNLFPIELFAKLIVQLFVARSVNPTNIFFN